MGVKKQHRLVLFLVCLILIGVTVYPHIPALVKVAQAVQGELKFGSTMDQVMTVINKTYYSADVFFGNGAGGTVGVLKGTGNVGIGTTTPSNRLEVAGNIEVGGGMGGITTQYIELPSTSNDFIRIQGQHDGGDTSNGYFWTADNANDGWYFRNTDCCGGGDVNYMRIAKDGVWYNGTGNVGIGSTAPTKKLDVVGDINFSGTLYQAGVAYQGSQWTTASPNIYYNTGNVGIGISSPQTKLDIDAGSLRAAGWSHYTTTRSLGPNAGDWIEIGRIAANGKFTKTNITIVEHNTNNLYIQEYEAYGASHSTPDGASWIALSPKGGRSWYALQNVAVDVTKDGTAWEQPARLRLRRISSAAPSGAGSVTVYVDTMSTFTELSSSGTGATVLNGFFGEAGWMFPVTDAPFKASTEGLFVQQSGNVGIGTTNPQKKLDIVAANSIINNTSGNLSIVPAANLLITQGNVGIGTTNPGYKLDVTGSIHTSTGDIIHNSVHGNYEVQQLLAANNGASTGDVGLYSWISEPGATWTGGGIARNMRNSAVNFPRINTGLSGQMIRFDEGATPSIIFTTETSGGTRYTPLNIAGNDTYVNGTGVFGAAGIWSHNYTPNLSVGRIEVTSQNQSGTDPMILRMHQWGSGAAEFYKPQGQTLYLRETPGGGGGWFTRFEVQGNQTITGNVGIGVLGPKGKLDIQGNYVRDSKSIGISSAWTPVLSVNMPANHTSAYAKIFYGGSDWGCHSAARFEAQFDIIDGAGSYGEPGNIIFQHSNTDTDQIQARLTHIDPDTVNIELRTYDVEGDGFSCGASSLSGQLIYEVGGNFSTIGLTTGTITTSNSTSQIFNQKGKIGIGTTAPAGLFQVKGAGYTFSATGGTITTNGAYTIHTFTGNGTFTPNGAGTVEVLVVGGGGGGGMDMGGGGGGGGVVSSASYAVLAGQPIGVTVGAGGTGAPAASTNGQPGGHQYTIRATNGGNSSFGTLTAYGGGYGGSSYQDYTPDYALGGAGASGGGASGYTPSRSVAGGAATQGYRGGNSNSSGYYSGGGGGAGGAGADGPNQPNGGPGVSNSILGTAYYWGGGGGGASHNLGTGGAGGIGGGGGAAPYQGASSPGGAGLNNGQAGGYGYSNAPGAPGGDGGINTGGGGGGGTHYNSNNKGGNGGSGIVIVRYLSNVVIDATLVVNSTGNVGIGTTSPTKTLEVVGTALLDVTRRTNPFSGSVLVNAQQGDTLNHWIGNPYQTWTLCFKKSVNGTSAAAWHAACNNKGQTVTIASLSTGQLMGGYAECSFMNRGGYYHGCGAGNFLFNLTKGHVYRFGGETMGNNNYAWYYGIYDASNYGPTFGGGHDWYVADGLNSGYCNLGYSYPCRKGTYNTAACQQDLCGTYNTWTITDLETWYAGD